MEMEVLLAEGESAGERGYYALAWRTLLPLARGGHTKAQCWVGMVSETGKGAPETWNRSSLGIGMPLSTGAPTPGAASGADPT